MSYSAGDLKWGTSTLGTPSGTITWDPVIGSGLNYNSSDYDLGDFEGALAAAFQAWEDVSGVDFEVASGTADVDISMASLDGSTVGYASYNYIVQSGVDRITSADVVFDSNETWSPYGAAGTTDFYAVALHEIGHVLGLHHVDDTSEIMNPYIASDTLGDGDIAGIQYLYGDEDGEAPEAAARTVSAGDGGDGGGGGGILGVIAGLLAALFGLGSAFGSGGGGMSAAPDDTEDEPEEATHGDGVYGADYLALLDTGEVLDDIHADHFDDMDEDALAELV